MAIKLTNNHKLRKRLAITGILILALISVCFFPLINQRAIAALENGQGIESEADVDISLMQNLYEGSYVLYWEQYGGTPAERYLKTNETSTTREEMEDAVNAIIEDASNEFEGLRQNVDYCVIKEGMVLATNTTRSLEGVMSDAGHESQKSEYSTIFALQYDADGKVVVPVIYEENGREDDVLKGLGQAERQGDIWSSLKEEWNSMDSQLDYTLKNPSDITIVFGIPKDADISLVLYDGEDYIEGISADYWEIWSKVAYDGGGDILYVTMIVLVALLMCILSSRKIWGEISMERPGKWYLMEAGLVGMCISFVMQDTFINMIWTNDYLRNYQEIKDAFLNGSWVWFSLDFALQTLTIAGIYGFWYLSIRALRPVFSLGIREYVRQYSFIYQIYPWLKKKWEQLKKEITHLDFSEKSIKTIVKIVILNFVVLAICSMMWFFGIFALVIYSVVLFFIIKKYYDKAGKDYQTLLKGVERIAEGDLDSVIVEDIGMFEPFKAELLKIRTGFKRAVDEEVKSQRMKTELITNVSHDLKTPLTAITTYVELLKKEDITEEERRSYIETLEKKSLRLKVLIEDLFEVSKATSNNIVLNPIELDVVNLLKQVSIEHTEKYEQAGLDLRFNVPEEKVICRLDNQKTYRIFENLFGNIQKYAMPGSRVYVDVERTEDGHVQIVMKNMSAQELNFKADEITERFVRGDSSRNTEGSGLGLAIAKSFTEAQGGKFHVEVDGDLFKAVIVF